MKWRRKRYLVAALGAALLVAVVVVVFVIVNPWGGKDVVPQSSTSQTVTPILGQEDTGPRQVATEVWPAQLALQIDLNADPKANQPADVALLGDTMFVADTNNGRLLEVSADGKGIRALDKQVDAKLALSGPMAVASYQGQIYVANSLAGQVVIVQPSGTVTRVIDLEKGSPTDSEKPRPIGLAVWGDGAFVVSDADNHRLLKYGADGSLAWALGSGKRDEGDYGFNVPGGVALDKDGNVYVVDVLNNKVKKYSPEGKFILAFGDSGDTAGSFSRPKAVAVDQEGNIYVSDGMLAAVEVFDPKGKYLGLVGRKDPADTASESVFQAPNGLKIAGGKLYVVDRFAGVFVFDLPGAK
jgi:sugar lactone lactonase YvrE